MAARREIRTALKAAAAGLAMHDEYWQDSSYSNWRKRPSIEIKFMTQGSFAYGTINAPAQSPHQEIDLDDGMYVPVDFLSNGKPALAAKGLFAFVESALADLCQARNWRLAEKPNCVRVKLWPGAHIDIPIYSIPQDRFVAIKESLEKSHTAAFSARDSATVSWRLPSDKIMLAQRDGTWLQSDPQQLHDWVNSRSERYGPVYKRLCRFFKGWRDYAWVKSPLSSLCIMCAIDKALQRLPALPSEDRDDALVLEVAKALPDLFKGEIENPVLDHLCINGWEDHDRKEIVAAASELRDEMQSALERTGDAELVVKKLRNKFGERIPYRPDSIKMASKIAAVVAAPASSVAAPSVIATTSG